MEEIKAQEVSLPQPVLSPEDMDRINNCEFYSMSKGILQSVNEYKEFEVGAAVHVAYKESGKLVCSDYEGKFPEKFIVIFNDGGFVFVKRINANGKPSAAVTCLSIEYPATVYSLRVDDGYVESMLLDTQDQYDPLADAKNLQKRKNKSARENAKRKLLYNTAAEAYEFMKTIKVGDTFYSSDYAYGGGVTEYKVKSIENRPATAGSGSGWSRSYGDQQYTALGFKDVIKVELGVVNAGTRYSYDKTIEFTNISKENSGNYYNYYKLRPLDPSDIAT